MEIDQEVIEQKERFVVLPESAMLEIYQYFNAKKQERIPQDPQHYIDLIAKAKTAIINEGENAKSQA